MTRFSPGDRVCAVVENPTGHSRLPRYLRGRRGLVEAVHGAYAVPEQAAAAVSTPDRRTVYTVSFDAVELWGRDAEARTAVRADIWEHQLAAATPDHGHGREAG